MGLSARRAALVEDLEGFSFTFKAFVADVRLQDVEIWETQ